MPAACRHSDVQVCAVVRDRLQQVKNMQVQDRLGPVVGAVHRNIESVPGVLPGALVAAEELRKVSRSGYR